MSRPARLLPRALVVGLLVLAPTPAEAAPAGPARSASTPTSTSTSAAKPAEAKPAAAKPAAPDPFAPAAAKSAAPDPFAPAAAQPSTAALTGQATGNARESEIYGERLDGIEAEVAALKDKIFRSKARLAVLRDTVLSGVMADGRVVLVTAQNGLVQYASASALGVSPQVSSCRMLGAAPRNTSGAAYDALMPIRAGPASSFGDSSADRPKSSTRTAP